MHYLRYFLTLPVHSKFRLLNELGGPDKVAELTGRKIRQVQRFDEKKGKMIVSYERRKGEGRFDQINIEERTNFQDGKKLVAILSEAASTGISLQADKRVSNQRRRFHVTLELPWVCTCSLYFFVLHLIALPIAHSLAFPPILQSADKAIQQLGRTHVSTGVVTFSMSLNDARTSAVLTLLA